MSNWTRTQVFARVVTFYLAALAIIAFSLVGCAPGRHYMRHGPMIELHGREDHFGHGKLGYSFEDEAGRYRLDVFGVADFGFGGSETFKGEAGSEPVGNFRRAGGGFKLHLYPWRAPVGK